MTTAALDNAPVSLNDELDNWIDSDPMGNGDPGDWGDEELPEMMEPCGPTVEEYDRERTLIERERAYRAERDEAAFEAWLAGYGDEDIVDLDKEMPF